MKRVNFVVKKNRLPIQMGLSTILALSSISLFLTVYRTYYSGKNEGPHIASQQSFIQAPQAVTNAFKPAAEANKEFPSKQKLVSLAERKVSKNTDELTEIQNKIINEKIDGLESLEQEQNSQSLLITLNSDVFFKLGAAKIEEAAKADIAKIADALRPYIHGSRIEIEGHTDDSPVRRQRMNFPTNWELSAARAASFIPVFSEAGFFKDQIKVIAYGDSRPTVSNHTNKELSAKNRRIVLRVFTGG